MNFFNNGVNILNNGVISLNNGVKSVDSPTMDQVWCAVNIWNEIIIVDCIYTVESRFNVPRFNINFDLT